MTCPLNFEIPVLIVRDEGGTEIFVNGVMNANKVRHSKLCVSNDTVESTWRRQFISESSHTDFCLMPRCHCASLFHVREAFLYNARDLYEYIGVHTFFGMPEPTIAIGALRNLPLINLEPPDLFYNNWFQKTARRDVMAGCGIFVVWLHRLRTPHAAVAFRDLPAQAVVNSHIIDADRVSDDSATDGSEVEAD